MFSDITREKVATRSFWIKLNSKDMANTNYRQFVTTSLSFENLFSTDLSLNMFIIMPYGGVWLERLSNSVVLPWFCTLDIHGLRVELWKRWELCLPYGWHRRHPIWLYGQHCKSHPGLLGPQRPSACSTTLEEDPIGLDSWCRQTNHLIITQKSKHINLTGATGTHHMMQLHFISLI